MIRPRSLPGLALAATLAMLGGCSETPPMVANLNPARAFRPYHETFAGKYLDQPRPVEPAAGPGGSAAATKAFSGGRALELLEIDGLVQAPGFQRYLEGVLQQALARYGQPVRPIPIYVEASDRLSAFATAADEIYVSLGLLELLESESELAAVLVHEAGHVTLDHFRRQEYFDSQREMVANGAAAGIVAITVANTRARKTGQGLSTNVAMYEQDPARGEQSRARLMAIGWAVTALSDHVLSMQWGRQQEAEADLFAIDLLRRGGYDPRGSADVLRKIGESTAERRRLMAPLEDAANEIRAELEKGGNPVPLLMAVPGKAIQAGRHSAGNMWDRFGASHPTPERRQGWANGYTEREHADVDIGRSQRGEDRERYYQALNVTLPVAVRRGHKAAQEAQLLLAQSRIADAGRLAAAGTNGPTAGSAHTRLVSYAVNKAAGKPDAAYADLLAIDPAELKPKRYFELLAAEHVRRGRPERAVDVIDQGVAQFNLEEPFLPSEIAVLAAADRLSDAVAAHERCRTARSDAVKVACDEAMKGLGLEGWEPVASKGFVGRIADGLGGAGSAVGDIIRGVRPQPQPAY